MARVFVGVAAVSAALAIGYLVWKRSTRVGGRVIGVFSGQVKQFGSIKSAFEKDFVGGAIYVSKTGLEGDEHVSRNHGGIERAILQYDSSHFAYLKEQFPSASVTLVPGSFGENISSVGLSEENVCIGDVWQIGAVKVVVTQPRKPCSKVNVKHQTDGLFQFAEKHAMSGWLYEVLEEGFVQIGDSITLLQRPNPSWTVARVQKGLYGLNPFGSDTKRELEFYQGLLELKALAEKNWKAEARNRLQTKCAQS